MTPAAPVFAESWAEVLREAQEQTVYFNAWGGSEEINAFGSRGMCFIRTRQCSGWSENSIGIAS